MLPVTVVAVSIDSDTNDPVFPGSIVSRSVAADAPEDGAYFVPYLEKNGAVSYTHLTLPTNQCV